MNARRSNGYNRPHVALRDLRQDRGLGLRDLERKTHINRAVWSQIERGLLLPTPEHLEALADVYGLRLRDFRIRFVIEVAR